MIVLGAGGANKSMAVKVHNEYFNRMIQSSRTKLATCFFLIRFMRWLQVEFSLANRSEDTFPIRRPLPPGGTP